MAELVDAPASGAGTRKGVEVRVLFWAPSFRGFAARAVLARCILAALVVSLPAGPAFAQVETLPVIGGGAGGAEIEPVEAVSTPIAAEAAQDVAIAERIRAIYREIDGLERVRVQSEAGVVTLAGRAADAALIERAIALAERVDGVVTINARIEEVTNLDERLETVAQRGLDRTWQVVAMLPLILVAIAVFGLAILVGRWIARRSWPFDRIAPNAFIANLLRQVVLIASGVTGLVLALDILNATALLSTVLGAAGILGLAVGFAVRDTVENYVASILLSLRQPFRPGDFVTIETHSGTVTKLTSRATVLLTPDGNHLRIPNSLVFKAIITNFSYNDERRFLFELGVDAESDLARAVALGLDVLRAAPFTLREPGPQAWIERVGDSNVVIAYAGWIDQRSADFLKAKGEAMRLVKVALEDEGFSLPEPIYRLKVDEFPPLARHATEPAAAPQPERKPVGRMETEPDRAIERQIEADLATDDGSRNLLDEKAPQEL